MTASLHAAPVLTVRNVVKKFNVPKGEPLLVVNDVTFEIPRRDSFTSIIGPSGCGKSTLLRLMAGLEVLRSSDSGDISLNGSPVRRPGPQIGYIFQGYSSFPWLSVQDNVLLGTAQLKLSTRERREKAAQYLELVGLGSFQDAFPSTLSGGQRQRLAVARALAADPEVLLLDEPFAAIDAQTRERMQAELLRIHIASGKPMVLVTHDIGEAALLGDRVLVLSDRPASVILDLDLWNEKPWRSERLAEYDSLERAISITRRSEAYLSAVERLRAALSH